MSTHTFNTAEDRKPESLTAEEIMDMRINWDRCEPLSYSSDQMNVNYPIRFPTIDVEIIDEPCLNRIADGILHEHGKGGYWDDRCDEIWYNFYLSFYQLEKDGKIRCGSSIWFEVENHPDIDPDVLGYGIELNEKQKAAFVKWFTDVIVPYGSDKTAMELFDEARSEMMDIYADCLF